MLNRFSDNKIRITTCLVFVIFFIIGQAGAKDGILVSGRGFEIDDSYVNALISFYESAGVMTSKDQYMEQAVKIKIFSQEARSKGLEPKEINVDKWDYDGADPVASKLIEDMGLAEAFINDVISSYPVDDIVIESYYRSNPEQFRKDPLIEEDILPLDDELKESIRKRMLGTVKNRIAEDVYSDLKDKYEVQTID